MKKIIKLLLIIITSITLISCNNNDKKTYYTVSFNTNGGTKINDIKFTEPKKINKPNDPIKDNATFIEWCIDENLEETFDFDKKLELKNYTLYAKWNVSIIFDTKGGNPINEYKRDANELVILPIPTDESGKQFIGWYYDDEFVNKVESIFTVPNHPITLYANWADIEKGTTIDFLQGLVINETNHYILEKNEKSVTITPTESKTVWSYLYSPISVSLDGYTVLHLKFMGTEDSQMIVKLEGGNVSAIQQNFDFTGELQDEYWIIPKENIASESGQRILIFIDGTKTGNDSDTTVEIQTLEFCKLKNTNEEEEQAIIFNSNGGSKVQSVTGKYNSTITMPENPTKPGYLFDGWYLDNEFKTLFTSNTMPMGPTTLYAKWINAPSHKVTFVTNTDIELEEIEVKEGITIPTEKLEIEGWEFIGWYRDELLTDSNLVMGKEDITIYAKWKTLKDLSDKENPYTLLRGWVEQDENTYKIVEKENELTITGTVSKAKYSYIAKDISAYNLKYTNVLHLEFEGIIGRKIIVKYNNKVEKKITITSAHQEEWILLTTPIDSSIRIILFYALNETLTEEESITFTKFELLDPIDKYDLIDIKKGWTSADVSAYEIVENSNNTLITATPSKGTWSFVRIDLSTIDGVDSKYIKSMIVELTGPKDHTVIIKYNNKKEQKIVLTGELQKIEIKFEQSLDLSLTNHLIIFIDGGKKVEENETVTFTKIQLKSLVHEIINPDDITYKYETVDIINGWTSPEEKAYEITSSDNGFTVVATTSKGIYSVLKYIITENYEDYYSIKIKVKGEKGKKGKYLLVKYNNAKEEKFELTGEFQEIEVIFKVALDTSKALYLFVKPGKKLEEPTTLIFEKIELVRQIAEIKPSTPVEKEYQNVSLLEGWTSADAGAYEISNENGILKITGTTEKKKFSVAKLIINELEIENTISFKIKVTGPVEHSMILKYNNKLEQKIIFTGEPQEVEITLQASLDPSIALYIFIDCNKTLTENVTIEIEMLNAIIEADK